jgi:hypothetical protein
MTHWLRPVTVVACTKKPASRLASVRDFSKQLVLSADVKISTVEIMGNYRQLLWHPGCTITDLPDAQIDERSIQRDHKMYNIFYIIGVIVVVLFILGYLGLR